MMVVVVMVIIAASTKNKLVVELQKHRVQGSLYNGGMMTLRPSQP